MEAPILILYGSQQAYLSMGCRFGGITVFGTDYVYLEKYDAFLQKSYLAKYKTHMRTKSWESFIEYVKSIKNKK